MAIIMPRMLTTRTDVDITVLSRGVGSTHHADRRPSDETSRETSRKTSKTTKTPPWRAITTTPTSSTTTMTPLPRNAPVAHFSQFDLAPTQPSSSSSSDLFRRVKSANAGIVRRQRHSASMQRSLSHSSSNSRIIHPSSSSQQTVPFLPIPPRKSDDTDDGRPRINTAEESDLARMYDYATWNMYERIVSARRKRLAQIELEKQQQLDADVKGKEETKPTTAEAQHLKDTTEEKKKKNCQEDRSITTAAAAAIRVVADATTAAPSSKREQHPQGQRGKSNCTTVSSATESYKDSSSTSSWSGADSPLPIAPFQNFTTNDEEGTKSTMSRYDSFIFELDM